MNDHWMQTFRARMMGFSAWHPVRKGEVPVSIKLRVASGCFHREHSPHAYDLIDRHLGSLSAEEVKFVIEEHESGPEILVCLAVSTAGIALATSIVDLIAAIVKARSDGVCQGDRPHDPLKLIIRRIRRDGQFDEEEVMQFESPVPLPEIEASLKAAVGRLLYDEIDWRTNRPATSTGQRCVTPRCTGLALPFSAPPQCSIHVEDLECWLEGLSTAIVEHGPEPLQREIAQALASNVYEDALLQDPIRGTLYREFKNEVDPRESVRFQFEEVVYFVIAAAASGIIGNLAYSAIKALVKRVSGAKKEIVVHRFEQVVTESRYDRLRIERHGEALPSVEVHDHVVMQIQAKYRILVERHKLRNS